MESRSLAPAGLPRAAAFAGVVFSLLLGITLVIVRLSASGIDTDPAEWLKDPFRRDAIRLAIHLAPFAGISFLWFIGVLRNRLGALEDQFFSTVFLGSGLLFVASMFASAALAAALMETISQSAVTPLNRISYNLARQVVGSSLNVFGIKMAGVFIISTSTIILRTSILPRWVAYLGFACAVVLLLIITNWPWIALAFPSWILIVSIALLIGGRGRTVQEA
jgi:hypothetical protein